MVESSTGITLLDGAMGTELKKRGVRVPSHITSVWSALALAEAPGAVCDVHLDYIEAGADVITTNNYAVTRPLLERENMAARLPSLTRTSIDLAKKARERSGRAVRIAGSLPPLETSYRPGLVLHDDLLRDAYREMVDLLAPHVDILLCETLSCAREARAAVDAACESDLPVWLSWTLQGDVPDRLPSGESIVEAWEVVSDLELSALLVNCCGANFVGRAIPILAGLGAPEIGGYANNCVVIPSDEGRPSPPPEDLERVPLDPQSYTDAALEWIEHGATIIGGCCFTRPTHIRELRDRLDARSTRAG